MGVSGLRSMPSEAIIRTRILRDQPGRGKCCLCPRSQLGGQDSDRVPDEGHHLRLWGPAQQLLVRPFL